MMSIDTATDAVEGVAPQADSVIVAATSLTTSDSLRKLLEVTTVPSQCFFLAAFSSLVFSPLFSLSLVSLLWRYSFRFSEIP